MRITNRKEKEIMIQRINYKRKKIRKKEKKIERKRKGLERRNR